MIPELQKACNSSCNLSLSVDLTDKIGQIAKMTREKGIVLGNMATVAQVDVLFTNSSTPEMPILTFETIFTIDVNFTMENVVFFPIYKSCQFNKTRLLNSTIIIEPPIDYSNLMAKLFDNLGTSFNTEYKAGIPIAAIDP